MTTPSNQPDEAPFDPYRFGRPDQPVPPEFAPPGYVPDGSQAGGAYPQGPAPTQQSPAPQQSPAYQQYPGQPGASGGDPGSQGQYPGVPYPGNQYPGTSYSGPQHYGQYYPGQQQTGYGAPLPPANHQYAQPHTRNGKATAALVLGILSIVLCWLSVFDAVFVVLALIFGLLALGDAKRSRIGRGAARAGLVCAVVGALLATVISIRVFSAISDCGGMAHSTTTDVFNQCVRDQL